MPKLGRFDLGGQRAVLCVARVVCEANSVLRHCDGEVASFFSCWAGRFECGLRNPAHFELIRLLRVISSLLQLCSNALPFDFLCRVLAKGVLACFVCRMRQWTVDSVFESIARFPAV